MCLDFFSAGYRRPGAARATEGLCAWRPENRLARMNHVNDPASPVPRSLKTSSTTPVSDTQPTAASYEAALQELEQLVSQLDAGQLPLDQLLTRYQRGAQLLAFCRARLEAVENQIKVLEGGELKPWDAA